MILEGGLYCLQGTEFRLGPPVTIRSIQILEGYFDLTSPENPATARRLKAQPTTDWK